MPLDAVKKFPVSRFFWSYPKLLLSHVIPQYDCFVIHKGDSLK